MLLPVANDCICLVFQSLGVPVHRLVQAADSVTVGSISFLHHPQELLSKPFIKKSYYFMHRCLISILGSDGWS